MPDRAVALPPASLPDELGIVLAEYRLSDQFRRPLVGRFILLLPVAVVTLGVGYTVPGCDGLLLPGWAAAPFAAVNLVLYFWRGRFCTQVTTEGLVIRGYFRHVVPWSEITGLDIRGPAEPAGPGDHYRVSARPAYGTGASRPASSRSGSGRTGSDRTPTSGRARLATVTVIRARGRRLLLRAPLVADWAPDHRFSEKAAELSVLWRWITGADG